MNYPPHINRECKNEKAITLANDAMKQAQRENKIQRLSDVHTNMRMQRLAGSILAGSQDPAARATFDTTTLLPHDHGTRRIGRPRLNWHTETMTEMWNTHKPESARHVTLNLLDLDHIVIIRDIAHIVGNRWTEQQKGKLQSNSTV